MPGLVGAPTRCLEVVLTARGVDLHVPALGAALCTADDRLAATVRVHHPLIPLEVWAAG